MDECATGLAQCAHGCLNTQGSFKCVCHAGYELGADGRQCYRELAVSGGLGVLRVLMWLPKTLKSVSVGQLWVWVPRGWLGSAGPCPTSQLSDVTTGIEMEIVNSCEAGNGGCSHGCSHTSTGPLCTCPHGYELDEDQKTCIGASQGAQPLQPQDSLLHPDLVLFGVMTWNFLLSLLL